MLGIFLILDALEMIQKPVGHGNTAQRIDEADVSKSAAFCLDPSSGQSWLVSPCSSFGHSDSIPSASEFTDCQ